MTNLVVILGLFGLLVVVIISIALFVYFNIKKNDDDEESSFQEDDDEESSFQEVPISNEITVSPDIDRKGYFMYPGGSNLSIQEYIKEGTPHGKVFLVPSGNKNSTIKIRLAHDNTFINYDNVNNEFSFDSNTGTEFTLVKGEIEGTFRLKVGDRFVVVKDDKLVMLEFDEILMRDIYNSLNITITEQSA
ncbi:MAG: hypothetical protein ACO3UU_15035 [Minisyncoccia bacterium]